MNTKAVANDLFAKIRGRFPSVTLGDIAGNVTSNPEEARYFDFDFKEAGKQLGKVSISIDEKDGLVVLHNTDFIENADSGVKHKWFEFLKELRNFAKSRMLNFDTRDITKSNLEKRDYQYLSQTRQDGEEKMSESNIYGTTKTSFQPIGNARLVIKHSAPIDMSVGANRSRRIESLFIESPKGERFRYPLKHLNGARAMAQHISNGGVPYDDFGKHIAGLSEELSKLKQFKTYINRSAVMAEGLKSYLSIVDERVEEIKNTCQKLQKNSYYSEAIKDYKTTEVKEVPEDVKQNWIDELTIKTFKEELKDVFPYIYNLVSEKTTAKEVTPEDFDEAGGFQGETEPHMLQYDLAGDFDQENGVSDEHAKEIEAKLADAGITAEVHPDEMRYQGIHIHTLASAEEVEKVLAGMIEHIADIEDFEQALNTIVGEAENGLFSSDPEEAKQSLAKLNNLMDKHFPAGVNGVNGLESLQGIIDDKELNDQIVSMGKEDSDACIRGTIMNYIKSKRPDLAQSINVGDMDDEFMKPKGLEDITFEDIKPYVSMYKGEDGKTIYDVLDKDSKSMFKSTKAKEAMAYLKKNFDALRKGEMKPEMPAGWEGDDDSVSIMKGPDGKISMEPKSDPGQEQEPKLDDPKNLDEFIKSHFDYTTNNFPKGETGLLTAIEKRFGEKHIKTAEAIIQKLMSGQDREINRMKKLAGV
jgi:hypothetical protein